MALSPPPRLLMTIDGDSDVVHVLPCCLYCSCYVYQLTTRGYMEGKASDDERSPSSAPAVAASPRHVVQPVVLPAPLSYIPGIGLVVRGAGLVASILSTVVSPLERIIGGGNLPPPNGTVRCTSSLPAGPSWQPLDFR